MSGIDPVVTGEAVACTFTQAVLGEGLRWDSRRNEILAVDILLGRIYRGRIDEDDGLDLVRAYQVPGTVGAIAPVQDDDGWIVAAGQGLMHLSAQGDLQPIAEFAPEGTRMNDGACDPQGRFWVGAVAEDFHPGGGALYRLSGDGQIELVLGDLTISNGLGWSPDGATMYLADSGPRVIHAFEFHAETATISNGRVLATLPQEVGAPDGLTVDANGDIWVAIYGGGRVHRYASNGLLREVLRVPTPQSTSCAFGGPRLDRLFVTTATEGWSDELRRAQPAAGLVYRFDTDAIGRSATPFRPEPKWWADLMTAR